MTEEDLASRLQRSVIAPLKKRFVGREEVIDLIAVALVAGEHLFLYGPPGTAKSALIRAFANSVSGQYFEYLLTRFSEPNELFGPIDLVKLREGTVTTVITGMLPEAEFVFLDELFNANSAILNNLLTVLNERIFRRGAETHRLPMLSLFSASNHLPEDEALGALFDRFLLRCRVEPLPRESMPRLLQAGWELERGFSQTPSPEEQPVTSANLRMLARCVFDIDLSSIGELYADLAFKIRDLGIALSDRRAVKVLKLVAASAVLCGRKSALASDLWVFRYVWDRDEQIGPLETLIQEFLRKQPTEQAHRLASIPEKVDAERLATELGDVERQLQESNPSLAGLARLREQITRLSDRAAWVSDTNIRRHLLDRSAEILEKIGT